ncbi:MAG: hypothetical protein AAF798_02155 [Bacteroidota bacterium]
MSSTLGKPQRNCPFAQLIRIKCFCTVVSAVARRKSGGLQETGNNELRSRHFAKKNVALVLQDQTQKNMSLAEAQQQKFQLIEWLVQLEDEEALKDFIALKQRKEAAAYEATLKPMTVEELISRAEASNRDIEAGRVYDINDVIREELGECTPKMKG